MLILKKALLNQVIIPIVSKYLSVYLINMGS